MSDDQFEAHIKSTAWYGVLSRAAKDDDEGASIFRMARMAASEAWQASSNLIEQQAARIAALEAQLAPVAPAVDAQSALTVWYGSMPESNGKSNWTAILHRGDIASGMTIDRSEYPDRVRYEADRVRWLIGELAVEPWILDYDADKHSGYATPQSEGWRKDAERREALKEIAQALTAAGEHSAYEIVYRALSQKEPQ